MKKTNIKLQLKTSTIRILQDDELAGVNGGAGADRRTPTNNPTQCSGTRDCPHHHP
jgi:hypothetical protein